MRVGKINLRLFGNAFFSHHVIAKLRSIKNTLELIKILTATMIKLKTSIRAVYVVISIQIQIQFNYFVDKPNFPLQFQGVQPPVDHHMFVLMMIAQ